jgi:GT2 family glycosyltransferase
VLKWSSRRARITGEATLKITRQPSDAWLSYLGFAAYKIIPLLAHDVKWIGHVVGGVSAANAASAVADGNIEYAGSLGELGGLVIGWAVPRHDTELWLFDAAGHREPLTTAIRVDRPDVRTSLQQKYGDAISNAGFLLRWPNRVTVGAKLKLVAVGRNGLQLVHVSDWKQAAHDPGAFAKLAFGVTTNSETFQDRMTRHDGVLIEQLLSARLAELEQLPVDVWTFGTPPREPKASVIVPLYGRWDFVEHQLLDFSIDPDFQRSVELIYVIDDPRLVAMKERAEGLWKTYGVPFKLVWGQANRGFAGANNLGVRNAKGDVLVFLNSDAFAKGPGLVSQLQDKLLEHPDFGAIGVRLLFADGGIQHAGMVFAYEENLGVWINKHPMMGMDPSVDQRKGLVEVPAVTAACVAVRRVAFDAVGGFDGGFLFGDFEDSDLCLKLQERGYRIGYLPDVELVHLERQSLRQLGDNAFRFKVVLYNAGRHTRKWAHHFAKLPRDGAAAT